MTKLSAMWIGAMVFITASLDGTNAVKCANPITYPTGKEEFRSHIYQPGKVVPDCGQEPIRLELGPHLFIDDFLIQSSTNVNRRVMRPCRDPRIRNPIITGKKDECLGPFMTVIRDADTGRFRIWYNSQPEKKVKGSSRFASMESEDGIHWIRPHLVIEDLGPLDSGCSVLDEGPDFADPSARYKFAWYDNRGLMIAVSKDGTAWKHLKSEPVLRHNHDINNIFYDTLRKQYVAIISAKTTGPDWNGTRRCTMQSTSNDLLYWETPWYILTPDDSKEKGATQFYAVQGHLIRGDLWIGLVKVLHDDWQASGTPTGSFGVGYTTLAWTRDGKNWVRDTEPFFEPDPKVGAWDHAHAWLDFQLPMGEEVYIYYGGYKNGHKMKPFEERQIGLVKIKRDRYVAREADTEQGTLRTPPVVLCGSSMMVNADAKELIQVQLLDPSGEPIEGFGWDDCKIVHGDKTNHAIQWKGGPSLPTGKQVCIEFRLKNARLYGFDIIE